jgi:capsular polysaccharide biosynthesis protein
MTLMDELITRFRKHTMFLVLIVLLPVLMALILSIVLPKKYISRSSILPANSRLTDKGRFSGDEIAELYSAYGSGDDLDRLFATARSYSVMLKIVDSFNLAGYYQLKKNKNYAREAAVKKLISESDIRKTEFGELQIRVWDKDSVMAANICNAIVDRVDKVHKEMYFDFYAGTLQKLEQVYAQKLSIARASDENQEKIDSSLLLSEELAYYRKSIADFRMAMQNPPPAFMVLEKAYPQVKPDKPRFIQDVLVTFLVSLFTGVSAILLFTTGPKNGES